MLKTMLVCVIAVLASVGWSNNAAADTFKRHRDHVLGTSFDLHIVGPDEAAADMAEAAILAEIRRLNEVFSLYQSSELQRLNASSQATVSDELREVWHACETYREQTRDALSCRIGQLIDIWADADRAQIVPGRGEQRLLAGEVRRANILLESSNGLMTRPDAVKINMDALAKGFILDKAIQAGRNAAPGVRGLLLNIGGDIRMWGEGPHDKAWTIAITEDSGLGDGASSNERVLTAAEGAVAASGQSARMRMIDGREFSHIISPRDGWPVTHIRSVTVFAPTALDADALATALMVLDLKNGLDLIESRPGFEAEIISSDGRRHQTSGWPAMEMGKESRSEAGAAWPENFAFQINLEIPEKDVADYERPYLAVWVADAQRNLVRILMLAGSESRWMEENYFWHRRFGRKAGSLVDAVAGPTRRPGQYELVWDGLTDEGVPAPEGEYVLHIEAAREHGSHQRNSYEFTLGSSAFQAELPAGDEIGPVTISLGAAQ